MTLTDRETDAVLIQNARHIEGTLTHFRDSGDPWYQEKQYARTVDEHGKERFWFVEVWLTEDLSHATATAYELVTEKEFVARFRISSAERGRRVMDPKRKDYRKWMDTMGVWCVDDSAGGMDKSCLVFEDEHRIPELPPVLLAVRAAWMYRVKEERKSEFDDWSRRLWQAEHDLEKLVASTIRKVIQSKKEEESK